MDVSRAPYSIAEELAEKIRNGELLVLERPGKSKVWAVFCRITHKNGEEMRDYVYCKQCAKVYKFNKFTNSNLLRHKCFTQMFKENENLTTAIKKPKPKAKETYVDVKPTIPVEESFEENENSITEIKKPLTPTEETEIDEKPNIRVECFEAPVNHLLKLLTKWIIKDCRPYDLKGNENLKDVFQELINLGSKLGSDAVVDDLLPSLPFLARNISEIYSQCFNRVTSDMASIKENGFSLTAYTWTDNFAEERYLAVTIHYLKNYVLTFKLLGLKALKEEQSTDKNVVQKIKEILEDFECELSSKSILLTNQGGDILKAFPETQIITCISQLLTNALLKSMDEIPEITDIINSCFKLVNKLKLNTILGSLFPTYYFSRWRNIYLMLKTVKNNWIEIKKALQTQSEIAIVSTIDIEYLEALVKQFQPFEEAIENLENDSYATLHLVLVYLHELKKSCDTNESDYMYLKFIKTFKENMRFHLEKIMSENITTLHKLALFLYPPANKLLQFSDQEKQFIEKECIRLMKCFENDATTTIQEPGLPATHVSKRIKLFSDFVESGANSDPNDLINEEIQLYKHTRVANTAEFDVLKWWVLQTNNLPLLYKLSCIVFATPATSAATKRIFSTASNLLCKNPKQSVEDTDIEKILFINVNGEDNEIDSHFEV